MSIDEPTVSRIVSILDESYPKSIQFLTAETVFQLLIMVILSAQTTDRQVQAIAPTLFTRFPDAESLAKADTGEVEVVIRSTGFFHEKARRIIGAARVISEQFRGIVPHEMGELLTIPGVGRKTAHVIRGAVFGLPAIIVDTHLARVVRRLGLVDTKDPLKIEQVLERIIPSSGHYRFSMTANLHGRVCCHARRPVCEQCPVAVDCPRTGVDQRSQRR